MNTTFKRITVSLLAAFTLAACENAQELAQKPEIAEAMVQTSLEQCETGPVQPENYAIRLRAVLMDTRTSDLRVLKENKMTVCLDQRLASQSLGTWDKRIDGILYKGEKDGIVSLWDDGTSPDKTRFMNLDAYDYGSRTLARLAYKISDRDLPAKGELIYAARYTCGKSCTTTKWKSAQDFDKDSIQKNPALQTPPLRATVPKPVS